MLRPVSPHRFSAAARAAARRLAGSFAVLTLAGAAALAQAQPDTGLPPRQDPPGGQPPNGGAPAGPEGSSDPAATDPAGTEASPAPPPDAAIEEATLEAQPKAEGGGLPEEFTPPAEPSDVMTIRKPLMSDAEIAKEYAELRKIGGTGINRAISAGELSPQVRDALARHARLQIARMTALDFTNPADRQKLGDLTRPLLLELRNAAAGQGNENREREFREAYFAEMVKAASQALDNNFYVRMQIATILSQMNSREAPPTRAAPPISYVPAMTPLLDMLAAPGQPVAVKIVAAAGVARIADFAESVPVEVRYRAADVLSKELAKDGDETHPWYQMRLAEGLAAIELDLNKARQPVVVNALLGAVAADRPCFGRSAAAKALGRTPIPPAGGWDDKVIASHLVQLARDMSAKYNEDPSKIEWFNCYDNLYLAFAAGPEEDVNRLPSNSLLRKGTLTGPLADAQKLILPIVQHIFSQPTDPKKPHAPIPTELIQALDGYLNANPVQPAGR